MTARGQAIVIATETAFRIAPNPHAGLIQMLPAERVVTLAGQYNGLWVSITTADSVLPGWVLGTDLRRLSPDQATAAISATGSMAASPTGAPASNATPVASPTAGQAIVVRPIAPVPAEPAPAPPVRSSLTISVTVVAAPVVGVATPAHAASTPTPAPTTPIAGIRVQLVDAFGELLAEAITGSDGRVALTHDVDAGQRVLLRLPAPGLELVVDPRQPAITISLPPGGQP
jgi:hypothetical protein